MRDATFETAFWRKAYESLPGHSKQRHLGHLLAAEQWELGLERAVEAWSRLKTLFAVRQVQPH